MNTRITTEARVKRLESIVKALALGWMFSAIAAGAYLLNPSVNAGSETLELRRLSIVDEKGVPRIVLGAPQPDPQINGKRYKRRSPSHGIQFNDQNGDENGGIGTLDDGSKTFCFDAKQGDLPHERICAFVFADGKTGFLVKDENGTGRASLGLSSAAGQTDLTLSDKDGKPRISLRVEPDGTPRFDMFDKDGKVLPFTSRSKPASR